MAYPDFTGAHTTVYLYDVLYALCNYCNIRALNTKQFRKEHFVFEDAPRNFLGVGTCGNLYHPNQPAWTSVDKPDSFGAHSIENENNTVGEAWAPLSPYVMQGLGTLLQTISVQYSEAGISMCMLHLVCI